MSQQQIDSFSAVTSSDEATAKKYLEFSGGDLEAAITFFFESGGTGITNSDADLALRMQDEAYNDEVRAPDEVRHEQLIEDPISYPVPYGTVPPRSFRDRGIFNQNENDLIENEEAEDDSQSDDRFEQDLNENYAMSEHQKRLARLFRPPFDIISNLTLDAGKKQGQREKKWVLVNIQKMAEFACQVLNRDFWSDPIIKEIVRNNFILLQYSEDKPKAQEYIQFNSIEAYPHIAILDPYSGERYKIWNTVPDKQRWIQEVYEFLGQFSLDKGHKNPVVKHKTKIDPSTLSEEQQVEYAMKNSLNNTRGSNSFQPILLDSDDESAPEFDDDDDDNDSLEDYDSNRLKRQIENIGELPDLGDDWPEPNNRVPDEYLTDAEVFATILPVQHKEPGAGEGVTRIQIRSPDGSRVVRRFLNLAPVREVYEVVKSEFPSVQGKMFSLTSQRVNLISKVSDTIEEAGLKNSLILLEFIEE